MKLKIDYVVTVVKYLTIKAMGVDLINTLVNFFPALVFRDQSVSEKQYV